MVVLKLKLSSEKPKKVYALNGRSYLLKPGSNTLNLDYNEYVSLAKALGITPVKQDEVKKEESPSKKPQVDCETEEKTSKGSCCCDGDSCSFCPEETDEEVQTQLQASDMSKPEEDSEQECFAHEETPSTEECNNPSCDDEASNSLADSESSSTHETSSPEAVSEDISDSEGGDSTEDYGSWSWADLRSEYKRVSGKACKLKKEAVIQFLRENRDVK